MNLQLVVPNEWADITVEQYQEFELNLSSNLSKKKKLIKSISILCNVDEKVVNKLKTKDLQEIALEINKLEKVKPYNIKLQKQFIYKGFEYGLIPNLSEMTTGEFIDLETWCAEDKATENLHRIMSILYRPIIEQPNLAGQYKIETYDPTTEKENVMLELPMNLALGCLNFFFHLGAQLINNLDNSLTKTNQ
mgnify:CR=1 FL=1